MWRNTRHSYGIIHIALHWGMAVTVFALFGLGLWMVDLDYYSQWYKDGPDLHRSIGVLLAIALVVRFSWRLAVGVPAPLSTHSAIEQRLAKVAHWLLYLLITLVVVAGYLISTADGRGVLVFDWFEIPALVTGMKGQEDLAGEVHYYLAVALVGVSATHALAALKHHVVDRDNTLGRIFGFKSER